MVKLTINELISHIFKKDKEVQPLTICLQPRTFIDCAVSCPLGVVDKTPYGVYLRETIFSYPSVMHKCLKRLSVSFDTLQDAQEWLIDYCLTTDHNIKDCLIVREYPTGYGT